MTGKPYLVKFTIKQDNSYALQNTFLTWESDWKGVAFSPGLQGNCAGGSEWRKGYGVSGTEH